MDLLILCIMLIGVHYVGQDFTYAVHNALQDQHNILYHDIICTLA